MGYHSFENYIERLHRCGISVSEAARTVYDMQKNFGWAELEEYIRSMEADCYVDKIQS